MKEFSMIFALVLLPALAMPAFSGGMGPRSGPVEHEPDAPATVELEPRTPLTKGPLLARPDHPHRLVVKFRDDMKARSNDGGLTSLTRANLDGVQAVVNRHGARFEPLIKLPQQTLDFLERRAAEHSGVAQPDLAGMFAVYATEDGKLLELAQELHDLPETEFAYFEHLGPPPPCVDQFPTTTDYTGQQNYAGSNPGVNMLAARELGNAEGFGIRIADCEYGFNAGHEDLCGVTVEPNQTPNTPRLTDFEHGTAVFGEMIGLANAYGVTGLVPAADGFFFTEQSAQAVTPQNPGGFRRVEAITAAIAAVFAGDIVVLEMQTGTPLAPAETAQAVWTVVRNGTDAGVIVVAAAGNGGADLDSASYATYRGWGDSGAIIVGAGTPDTNHDAITLNDPTYNSTFSSTFGSRVNVQGWGQLVVTLGYGDLAQLGTGVNQRYTQVFNGTSSATPIVAACCAALQGFAIERWGQWLSPRHLRDLLVVTGIPQGSGGHIGPLPNVTRATDQLEPSTWVDFNSSAAPENGSFERPFNTLDEGLVGTPAHGLVRIKAGAVPGARIFSSPVRMSGWNGTVRIGAP